MSSKIFGAVAGCVLAFVAPAAEAALIRVDFSGVQTGGTVSLPGGPAGVNAWFVYDDAAPNTAAPGAGYLAFIPSVGAFSVSNAAGFICGGGFDGLGQILVRNDVMTSVGPRDVASGVGISPLGCLSATTTTSIRLIVSAPSTAWNDAIPSFDKWTNPAVNFLQIVLGRSDGALPFIFNVTSLEAGPPAEVPLPAAAPLFLLGLAAMMRRKRWAR